MITDADRLRELLREHTPQPPRDVDLDDVAARVHAPARAPIPLRRLSPLAAIAVVAAVVVLVLALQHSNHNGKPGPTRPASPRPTSAPTGSPTPTHAPSRPVQPPAGEGIVYSTDVYSAGFAVVVVGPGPDGSGHNRLLATTNWGRTFTDIGPTISGDWNPDSLFVLDPSHLWLSVYNPGTIGVAVYRTSDGGSHWQSSPAGSHNAGGRSVVDFVDQTVGFIFETSAGANSGSLLGTHDGGASWGRVTDTSTGAVPAGGQGMHFTTARTGWVAGFDSLYRSDDGGMHWIADVLPGVRSNRQVGVPSPVGTSLLETVANDVSGHTELTVWRADGGWQRLTTLDIGAIASGASVPAPPSTAFPSLNVGWASGLDNGLVVAYRWDGRQWTRVTAPYGRTIFRPHIAATDADHAWLSFTQANNLIEENNTEVYRTSDGGRSWQRIDLAALATR